MSSFAIDIHATYLKYNPLQRPEYWTYVTKFLTNLNQTIYLLDHQMHFSRLCVDNYYFLTKMCVDYSFTVPEIIYIRNQREKVCKLIANEICHEFLPKYILSLQATCVP